MLSKSFVVLSLLAGSVLSANDWSVPCWDGVCEYDNQHGSMKIWGSPLAISDITKAAGWTILDCEPDAVEQKIRLVCHNENGCPHLSEGGAVNTLVRLPESCGANAFARVARIWVHANQNIPGNVVKRNPALRRRDDNNVVQGIELDTNFDAVDPAENGDVNIAVQGSNIPEALGNATIVDTPAVENVPASRRRSRHNKRGLFSFIKDAFKKFDKFDKEITKTLPPVDFDKPFNLFDQKLDCAATGNIPAFTAELRADLDAKAHAVISVGIAATGTIIPPLLTSVGVFAGMDADITGSLKLSGSASAEADSGKVTVFETGIPGLDFPGILTVGPSFVVDAQATGKLDIGVDAVVTLNYKVDGAKLFFPPNDEHPSKGGFGPTDSPFTLSVTPSVASHATVSAHLIPALKLGVSALGGAASANVFLNLDASAQATLSLGASATAAPGADLATTANGCVDVSAGLGVNAGVDAKFFNLFDPSKQVNLFQKNFELFNKCFGDGNKRELLLPLARHAEEVTLYRRFNLACPTDANFGSKSSLVNEAIPAASIKTK